MNGRRRWELLKDKKMYDHATYERKKEIMSASAVHIFIRRELYFGKYIEDETNKLYEVSYTDGTVEHRNLVIMDLDCRGIKDEDRSCHFVSSDGLVDGYYAYLSGLRYYCFPREEFLIQTLMGTCMNKLQTVNEIKDMFK